MDRGRGGTDLPAGRPVRVIKETLIVRIAENVPNPKTEPRLINNASTPAPPIGQATGFVALTIAPYTDSASSCVGTIEISVNPAAVSSVSYSSNESAPAMHPI